MSLFLENSWIVCTEGICNWVLIDTLDRYPFSIPLIDTLDRPLIDTQLTFHWHLGWHLINTPSTSWLTVSHKSTYFIRVHMSRLTPGQLSIDCWSSVNWVLTECQLGCNLSTDRNVDWGYHLRVLIDTWVGMFLVHMIQILYHKFFSLCVLPIQQLKCYYLTIQ